MHDSEKDKKRGSFIVKQAGLMAQNQLLVGRKEGTNRPSSIVSKETDKMDGTSYDGARCSIMTKSIVLFGIMDLMGAKMSQFPRMGRLIQKGPEGYRMTDPGRFLRVGYLLKADFGVLLLCWPSVLFPPKIENVEYLQIQWELSHGLKGHG